MWLLALLGSAWADCPAGPTSTVGVQRFVEQAEFAFVELDDTGLRANRDQAVQTVLCLGELVHPPHAAAFLRLEGVFAFVNENPTFALDAFRSALTVQPDFQMKAAIAPAGGPLAGLYAQARGDVPTMWALPQPGKAVFVNGVSTTHAPYGLSIVQVVEPTGQVGWTGIVTGPNDLPPWFVNVAVPSPVAVAPQPVPAPFPVPAPLPAPEPFMPDPLDEDAGKKPPRVPLLVTAGIIAAAAGGMYAGSAITRTRYDAAPTAQRRQLTNTLFLGAAGAGIVSLGVATVAVALPAKKPQRNEGVY
ncbi:MAG: hypothetical protein H6737_26475 [Alphaproteobacteria bacterium]|nr:hypothetical protein [Alphaproteobacteria bacterium]